MVPLIWCEAALWLKDGEQSACSSYVFIIIPKLLCHKSHFPSWGMLVQSCWLPFPSFHQLTAPARPWEQHAGGSLTAIPAHRLRTQWSRCCVVKEILPIWKWLEPFLLSNSAWNFSRKKGCEALEDFRVDLLYKGADSADAGHSSGSRAQTQTPRRPWLCGVGVQWQTCAGALQCSCRHHVAGGGIAPGIDRRICSPPLLSWFLPSLPPFFFLPPLLIPSSFLTLWWTL